MANQSQKLVTLVHNYVEAFIKQDILKMSDLIIKDVKAHITNKSSGTDLVVGRENLLKRLTMDVKNANLKLEIAQIVTVSDDMVMFMVEISASSNQQKLNNFSTFLLKESNEKIKEMWMVEAFPAKSDEFWRGKKY